MGKTTLLRQSRVGLAALVLVAALLPAAAPPVAAAICDTSYCATLTIYPNGTGAGRVTSDDGGIDCSWNGFVASGTCFKTYSWTVVLPSINVTLTYY